MSTFESGLSGNPEDMQTLDHNSGGHYASSDGGHAEIGEARLIDLDFSDLYVPTENAIGPDGLPKPARYNPSPKDGQDRWGNLAVPAEFDQEIEGLAELLREHAGKDFAVTYPKGARPGDPETMRLRVSRQIMLDGEVWACCRRLPSAARRIEDLGFQPHDLALLQGLAGRDGLLIITGATGDGKTTTATALLQHYVEKVGRVGITIEDPIEYVMQGEVGESGHIWQIPVMLDSDWQDGIRTALRFKPRFIFVGEIRTREAATEVLQAASSGHLVICTIHGATPSEAASRIIQLASADLDDTAKEHLANSLVGIVHQRLVNGKPRVYIVHVGQDDTGKKIKTAIRDGKLQDLTEFAKEQEITRRNAWNEHIKKTGANAPKANQGMKPGASMSASSISAQQPLKVNTGSSNGGSAEGGTSGGGGSSGGMQVKPTLVQPVKKGLFSLGSRK